MRRSRPSRAVAALLVGLAMCTGGVRMAVPEPVARANPAYAGPPATAPAGPGPGYVLVPSEPAWAGGYRWPLDGQVEVARGFDPPVHRWLAGHRGVDLAAAPEAVVRAAGDGVVRFVGPVVDRQVVSVDHPGGLRTTYEPLTPLVAAGDQVRAGDPVGLLAPGHAGCPHPACLHWGLRMGDLYLDPLSLLGLGRARLLPATGVP